MKISDKVIPQRFIEIEGQQIPVTEEVYRAYKQPLWTEHKRKEREKRCAISNGKGKTKRCTKSCRECDQARAEKRQPLIERTGSVVSLDYLAEEGFEAVDPIKLLDIVTDTLLLKELHSALEELDPDNRRIMELFSIGKSEREIADDIGLSQKAVNKRKNKLFAQLSERLNDYR